MMKRLTVSLLFFAAALLMTPAQAERRLPFEADPPICADASARVDRFALNLFRDLAAEGKGNIILSPASLEAVLHLLREGAAGETRTALAALPLGRQGVTGAMQVESANALFADDGLRLNICPAELHRVPFASRPDRAVKNVNDWCRRKTHGLVPEIASVGDFTPQTRLVALNVVYLRERWLRPFNEEMTQRDGSFTTASGRRLCIPLMRQTARLRYAEGRDWQAVALFYRRDGRSGEPGCFIGILPKGNARAFARRLSPECFGAIRRALACAEPQETAVTLPKMDMDSGSFSLRDSLCRLGLSKLFTTAADFRGFADEPLFLSDVLQRCRVIVSEKETEAAAVTMAVLRCKAVAPSRPKEIHFTRPFIWAIGDLSTEAPPWFLGLCEEPCNTP